MQYTIGGYVSDGHSGPNLSAGLTPYERSLRAEISEEKYHRLEGEHLTRLNASKEAFERSAVEAAERYMQEQKREHIAFYGHDFDEGAWDLGKALGHVVKRTIPEGSILEYISEITGLYARHAGIKPDGFVYVLEAGPYYKIGRTSNLTPRIKTLKIQLPFPVRCVAAFPCEEASRSEAELHERFGKDRVNGEWFTLPDRKPWMTGLTWLKNIRYATTEHIQYLPGTQVDFHQEVPLAVHNNQAWRVALAAASDAVEIRV